MTYNILPEEILENIPLIYYIIDLETFEIQKTNNPAFSSTATKCHKFLFEKENPCEFKNENCICSRFLTKNEKASFVIENKKGNTKEIFRVNASLVGKKQALVFYENITEVASIQKELKINNKRLERAETLAKFGSWEININDNYVFASKGAKQIYGVDETRLKLDEVRGFALPEFRERLGVALHNLIYKNEPYNIHYKVKRKNDGAVRHIHSIAEYREDKKMVFGVINDVTETELTQYALMESENSLKQLFENMNSAFAFHKIVTDSNGEPVDYITLDVNPKFEEISGEKAEDIINKSILEVHPDTEKFWIEIYGEVALTGKAVSFSEYSEQMKKFLEISAYSPRKNYFAVTFNDISAKVKSERALNDSLMDLKMAQRIAKIGSWKFNPENKTYKWSDQVFDIIERKPEKGPLRFNELEPYFSSDDFQKFKESIDDTLFHKNPFEIQLRLLLPGNRSKWIEVICQPGEITHQNEYFLRGTVQDITANKNADEEIYRSNQLLRTVIDNVTDAIYLKDTQYRKLIANLEDTRRSGFEKPEDIIGKSDFDLYPFDVAQKYVDDDRKVIENGEAVVNKEEILPDKKGDRTILTSKFPLKNDNGEILGLVGIGRDITELKEHASKVHMLQQTVEQTPLAVLITNPEGKIEYVNAGFTKISGYAPGEVIGQKTWIFKSGFHDEKYYSNLWETISSGKNWYGEFFNKRKNGETYWEGAVIAPIFDEKNNIIHFVAIKEDITGKKQMIDDLKKAKKEAEESSRLKSLFLTNLSHEIRTPLNGILGFSNIICSGIAEKNKLEYYGKIIEKSGNRLMKMVDDIIDISMLQSDQMRFDFDNFNLNDMLQDLYFSVGNLYLDKKDIVLKLVKCSNESFTLFSDKNRLNLVMTNLLFNAYKFTESGEIKFGFFSSADNEVTLFVKDTGIGIADDKKKVIFEAFRQAEEGDARKFEGSGLGLAVASGILEKLQGSINVESELGKGSVFYIKVPVNKM